jgi:uncharacterized protein YndB with AHSA1/START domain
VTASLTCEIDIAADAERVWRLLTDWPAQGEWMLATSVEASGPQGVGQRIVAVTGIAGRGLTDEMVVTAWDPPRLAEVMHVGRVLRGPGIFEVAPTGPDRCRLIWREELELPFGRLGQWGWRVARPVAAGGVRASLRRFARLAEASGGAVE